MSLNNQTPDLISKLKAMYIGGSTEAERDNALDKIKRQCEKHGLNVEDILREDEKTNDYQIQYWNSMELQLLRQVGAKLGVGICGSRGNRKIAFILDATVAQYIDVKEHYEHYRVDMHDKREQMNNAFFIAYLSTNNIFRQRTAEEIEEDSKTEKPDTKPTFDVDMARAMMNGMEATSPQVKIGKDDSANARVKGKKS